MATAAAAEPAQETAATETVQEERDQLVFCLHPNVEHLFEGNCI